jgi:pimeloyl-ACP methyl ester carboxylesterase
MSTFQYRRSPIHSKILGKEVQWGSYRADGLAIRETIYLLHGANGDDEQFAQVQAVERLPERLQQALRDRGAQLVLPFIGGSCLHGAFSKYFFEEVVSLAEAGTQTSHATRRVAGLSMGGHAALNVFFRHPELFAAVGAHFPMVISFDAWDDSEWASYQKRTGIPDAIVGVLKGAFRSEFADQKDYASCDPIALAAEISPDRVRGKAIYFDAGTNDMFGIQEGSADLAALLKQRGIAHEFHKIEGGGHDADFVHARFEKLMEALLSESSAKASLAAGVSLRPEASSSEARV